MSHTILCGMLFDGEHDEPFKKVWITINNSLIESISNTQPAEKADILDLSQYTVLPGFIDCHDHVCLDPGDEIVQAQEPSAWLSIKGAARVKTIVEAGVTTLRNAGEHERIDLSLKRAIDTGMIPGPRLLTAGIWICRTGGHGWFDEIEADGPWEIRKAIREEVKHGVDWIKIMVTGGISTPNSDPLISDFTEEEIFAAVDEAHRLGKKIAAHAHGGPGVDYLIEAGVDSIEHGFYITEFQLREMAKKGIYLCSTYGIIDAIINEPTSPDFSRNGCIKVQAIIFQMLNKAIRENVPIVVGTDGNHGKMAVELDALIKSGYSHSQALKALTSKAAKLLRMSDQVGAIKVGLKADFVVIDGNPLKDIYEIENIKMVIKDGKIIFKKETIDTV
jgi:imidazolonepropionase-like amidohydrolase